MFTQPTPHTGLVVFSVRETLLEHLEGSWHSRSWYCITFFYESVFVMGFSSYCIIVFFRKWLGGTVIHITFLTRTSIIKYHIPCIFFLLKKHKRERERPPNHNDLVFCFFSEGALQCTKTHGVSSCGTEFKRSLQNLLFSVLHSISLVLFKKSSSDWTYLCLLEWKSFSFSLVLVNVFGSFSQKLKFSSWTRNISSNIYQNQTCFSFQMMPAGNQFTRYVYSDMTKW